MSRKNILKLTACFSLFFFLSSGVLASQTICPRISDIKMSKDGKWNAASGWSGVGGKKDSKITGFASANWEKKSNTVTISCFYVIKSTMGGGAVMLERRDINIPKPTHGNWYGSNNSINCFGDIVEECPFTLSP